MEAFILSETEQGVMTITLNRPDRLNSFNDLMHQQLAACLKQAERAASTISQPSASVAPAPAATPFTAQITGFGSAARRRTSGL